MSRQLVGLAFSRTRVLAPALLVAACMVGASLVDGSAGGRGDFSADTTQSTAGDADLDEFLSLPFVSRGQDGELIIDFARDPEAAATALTLYEDQLDGLSIQVEGISVASGEARRSLDAALSADDRPVAPPLCPDRPSGPRPLDGGSTPYLGCSPRDGTVLRGPRLAGPSRVTLAAALTQVLAHHLPSRATHAALHVDLNTAGALRVNLSRAVANELVALEFADAHELLRDIWFTVYSNGDVQSLTLLIDGDCLAFALAVGGDQCSTTYFGS